MSTWLRQSTAVDVALGPFVDATDGFTPETALVLTQAECRLKKNGGAWAQKNNATTAPHEEEGWYEVNLSTTDTDTLGILVLAVYVAGALPVWREFMVLPAAVYDAYLATGVLPVNVTQVAGTAQTAGDIMADTNDIQARLPTALESGRMAAAIPETQIDQIVDEVWDEPISGHLTAGSAGEDQNNLDATISSRASPADVLAQTNAALDTAVTQPGQDAPPVNPSLRNAIARLYKAWRNRTTQTTSQYSLYGDDATTIDQKASFSDDGTVADRGEVASGP